MKIVHNDAKTIFPCDICSDKFKTICDLEKHIKSIHMWKSVNKERKNNKINKHKNDSPNTTQRYLKSKKIKWKKEDLRWKRKKRKKRKKNGRKRKKRRKQRRL